MGNLKKSGQKYGKSAGRLTAADATRRETAAIATPEDQSRSEEEFRRLVRWWKSDVRHLSSTTQLAMHPAYQQIIGMGPSAIPLLLGELEREPDHWFWALKAVTRLDPVAPEDRGHIKEMAAAWLRWGKEKGFKWRRRS